MAEYVYVGRHRSAIWLAVWQILTLGVYGRVWAYKVLREFDGHETLFMDRRPYLPLLILPLVGPFFVKRRIALLLGDLVHHDVTAAHHHRLRLMALALVPLLPFFHPSVQHALNHHWKMHTKETELQLKQEQLDTLRRRARSPDQLHQVKELEADVKRRSKELQDLRNAALALREAEEVRRLAELESRRGGVRAGPLGMVRKILPTAALRASLPTLRRLRARAGRARAETAAPQEPEPREAEEADRAPPPPAESAPHVEAPAPARRWFGLGRRKEEPMAPGAAEASVEPEPHPRGRKRAAEPPAEAAEGPKERRPLFGFLKGLRGTPEEREARRKAKEEAREEKRRLKEEQGAARMAEREAKEREKKGREREKRRLDESRRRANERKKQRKREARAKKRAEKVRQKELRRLEKERRRQDKQQEKERKKQEKQKEKERRKQVKQRAREAKRKEKEAAKAQKPRKAGGGGAGAKKSRAKR